MLSKKHKEAVFRLASQVKVTAAGEQPTEMEAVVDSPASDIAMAEEPVPSTSSAVASSSTSAPPAEPTELPFESSGDAKLDLLVARRIQAAPPIPVTSCLFCTNHSTTISDNVAHMRQFHSFIIPDEEYLVDVEGLLRRLGEEVGTWNVCVCCNKGYGGNIDLNTEGQSAEELSKKASKGVEAVRAHMKSKVRSAFALLRSAFD